MSLSYGSASLENFAKALQEEVVEGDRDWSVDIAYHLAMALNILEVLKDEGVDVSFMNRDLLRPHLEEVWRELIYLRTNRLSDQIKQSDVPRRVTFSLVTGEIKIDEEQNYSSPKRFSEGGSDDTSEASGPLRRNRNYRRRIYRRTTERSDV